MAATKTPRRYVVRHSPIHGRGVFAASDIPKGERIIEYRGERIAWSEALKRPDSDPDNPYHTFFFSLDDGRCIDASVGGNAARWINHSCQPNCETEEDDEARVHIFAKRDIVAGEELTYDYRLSIDGRVTKADREGFACRCGTRRCRGTMLAAKKPAVKKATAAGKPATAKKARPATKRKTPKKAAAPDRSARR